MKLIRISNPKAEKYILVEWQLHNVCNYDCSFCDSRSKGGDLRWLEYDQYIRAVDRFIDQAESRDCRIYFLFTGGEPTLMPNFLELVKYIKSRGHYVTLITNGSRTLRWWETAAEGHYFDNIWFSVHTEQGSDLDHAVKVIELFKELPTNITTIVTAPPDIFDQCYANHRYIIDHAVCISSFRYIYQIGGDLLPYTAEQRAILAENNHVKSKRFNEKVHGWVNFPWQNIQVHFEDGSVKTSTAMHFVSRGIYHFFGWRCSAGINSIRIDHTQIYRGTCRQGGAIGNILDQDFGFAENEITCLSQRCKCIADFNQPKYKI